MRQILGYVPIEPDGSVRVTVPANVAFQISVVDANAATDISAASRLAAAAAGRGARAATAVTCRRRSRPRWPAAASILMAARAPSRPPGADRPAPACSRVHQGSYVTCPGETMAEALVGWNCGAMATAAATPSVNVVFNDPWFGGGVGNEPVLLSYDDPTFTTPLPTTQACALPWRLDLELSHHHQLPDQHPAAVGQTPWRQYLRQLPYCIYCGHRLSGSGRRCLGYQCQPGQRLSAADCSPSVSPRPTPPLERPRKPWYAERSSFPATRSTPTSSRCSPPTPRISACYLPPSCGCCQNG